MRFGLAVLALTLCVAPPSFAQELRVWQAPSGVFALTIPEGWQTIDQLMRDSYLLVVGPPASTATASNPQLPVCGVEGRPVTTQQMSQDEINRLIESMPEALMRELNPIAVHSSSSELIGGVRVLSLDIDQQTARGPTRQMQRIFAVPHPSGLMHYQIGCGASGSAYETADISVLHGFLASLSLASEAQPQ